MKVQESAEDYLESILILKEKKGLVRSIDVVHHMGYSKPSVSRAMSLLRENGYVEMDKEGFLTLTEAGMTIASPVSYTHLDVYKRQEMGSVSRWPEGANCGPWCRCVLSSGCLSPLRSRTSKCWPTRFPLCRTW